jgi:hypothetical protein
VGDDGHHLLVRARLALTSPCHRLASSRHGGLLPVRISSAGSLTAARGWLGRSPQPQRCPRWGKKTSDLP